MEGSSKLIIGKIKWTTYERGHDNIKMAKMIKSGKGKERRQKKQDMQNGIGDRKRLKGRLTVISDHFQVLWTWLVNNAP
jgi:hypothetical protein